MKNMDFRIAIVDDRKEDMDHLEKGIRRFFSLHSKEKIEISTYPSAEDFLPVFSRSTFRMAFLDIVMDEMNGIDLAKKLREADENLLIVFQTTSREYAFDAFPVHPFDYLMKPVDVEDLDSVLTEALRVIRAGDPEIKVGTAKGTFNVPLRAIIAVASQGHRVELSLTNDQSIVSTETFKSIHAKLASDPRFLEINRGILINMDQVLMPTDSGMKMKNGTIHPIRVNGRTGVLASFSQYMISRVDRRDV